MRTFGVALASLALLFSAGCGGSDDRPSSEDLGRALQQGKASDLGLAQNLPKKAADCIAKTLVDSDLSDAALESIVKKDKKYKLSKADEKALAPLISDLRGCLEGVAPK